MSRALIIFTTKWIEVYKELAVTNWDRVWDSIHQGFFSEMVKSTIWEQIHLNFYTTYSYNIWHKKLVPCTLCKQIPDDIFHIIMDCTFTKCMWKRIEKTLIKITPKRVTKHEMVFGLQPRNKKSKKQKAASVLRNCITFSMRNFIMMEERRAYKSLTLPIKAMQKYFRKFNHHFQEELKLKKLLYDHRLLSYKFENIATVNKVTAAIVNGDYEWKDIM